MKMSSSEREQAILSLKSKVEFFSKRIYRKSYNNGIELEELISIGWLAAIEAVDKFDSTKSKLTTFSDYIIYNRILDYIRSVKGRGNAKRCWVEYNENSFVDFNFIKNINLKLLLEKINNNLLGNFKRVYILKYKENYNVNEICNMLNITSSKYYYIIYHIKHSIIALVKNNTPFNEYMYQFNKVKEEKRKLREKVIRASA